MKHAKFRNYHIGFKNHQFSFTFIQTLNAFLTQSAPSSLSESLLSPNTASRGWSGPWFSFFGTKSPYLQIFTFFKTFQSKNVCLFFFIRTDSYLECHLLIYLWSYCWMAEWLINWKRCRRKRPCLIGKYDPGIYLEGLKTITNLWKFDVQVGIWNKKLPNLNIYLCFVYISPKFPLMLNWAAPQ